MKLEDAVDWYGQSRFTADDVTRATGLSERSQRELLKLGILSPVPQAKTKARLLNSHMVKRAAVIAPLIKSGLSLQVAGKIVAAALMLEDFYFDLVDPWYDFYDRWEINPETGLYQPHKRLEARHNFDPETPAAADQLDYGISIFDARFVVVGSVQVSGELTPDLTDFVWWDNAMYDHIKGRMKDGVIELSVGGTKDHSPVPTGTFHVTPDPKTISFNIKTPTVEDETLAAHAQENPVSVLKINASLALRIALRRLLYIDKPPARQRLNEGTV